jgi:tetratricopeptide (TPR) repeat protein
MNPKFRGIALSTMIAGGMLATSCTLVKDLEYTVQENPLQMHGDKVEVKINGKFIEKGLNKKAVVDVTPTFICTKDGVPTGTEIPFDTRTFQGEKAAGNGEVIPKGGKSFSYTSSKAYQACMEEGILVVKILPKKGTKEKDLITTDKIADGTIITPYMIVLDNQVIACDDNFKRITTHDTTLAVINYEKGKFNVRPAELKQADILGFENFIKSATPEARREIKTVKIQSYASPEGEIDKNNNLAADRAKSAQEYGVAFGKRAKLTQVENPAYFTLDPKGEDWAGFKEEVQKTTHEDKELILRVLEMTSDLNKREEEIRNMAKTYIFLEKSVLPQLRRSAFIVTYDKVGYSDDELKQLSTTNPSILTVEELLYSAELFDDLNTKLKIYQAAETKFPDDYRTSNNVGYVLYLQGDLDGAKAKFEKANTTKQNPISTNNLGAVAHMKGDREKAKALFAEAGNAKETNYNLGLIAIQEGQYGEAVNKMNGNDTYNMALAKILNGEGEAALTVLNKSAEKESAYAYYLRAIIGARAGKVEDVNKNLKIAIEKDAKLKAKGKIDAEFIKFRDNADFKAIVG